MDSDRRHELETNDLREFLDNFKDFWDKHGNRVLITLILVLGSYTGYRYYSQWKTSKSDEANSKLAAATSAPSLLGVAADFPLVHDEATRRAADILLAEARTATVDDKAEDASAALDKASAAYKTLAETGKTTEYQLIGHDGLANVLIMQSQWDQAAAQYQKVIDLAGETYLGNATRAKAGLEKLESLKNPIAFAPPEPEPAPAPAPESATPTEDTPTAPAPTDAAPAPSETPAPAPTE